MNTPFSWQSLRGDIHTRCNVGEADIDITWSSEPPRCEYIAKSSPDIRRIYFLAGHSIDIAKAILKELSAELNTDLLRALEKISQELPHAVVHALLQYLSPTEYSHLTIFCADHSYWRFPGSDMADPSDVPCPKGIISMPMPQNTSFTPKAWIMEALPDATKKQASDVYTQYQKRWSEMREQQRRETTEVMEELAKSKVDFHSIPLEPDDNEVVDDQSLSRDRQFWVMKHGPVSPAVIYELVSRLAPKKISAISGMFPTLLSFASAFNDMGAGFLERGLASCCLGPRGEDDQLDPASAA